MCVLEVNTTIHGLAKKGKNLAKKDNNPWF